MQKPPLTARQKATIKFFSRPPLRFSVAWEEDQRESSKKRREEAEAKVARAGTIGMTMRDGAVYAGISPDTGRPMFAAAENEPHAMTFNQAAKRAEKLSRETGRDYRVPSISELILLFNNKSSVSGFSENEPYPKDCYLSSSFISDDEIDILSFSNGNFGTARTTDPMSVCLVRN